MNNVQLIDKLIGEITRHARSTVVSDLTKDPEVAVLRLQVLERMVEPSTQAEPPRPVQDDMGDDGP